MDLTKYLKQHITKVPPAHPDEPGSFAFQALYQNLQRDLSLLIQMPEHVSGIARLNLLRVWMAELPEDQGTPYLFCHIPETYGLLLEFHSPHTLTQSRARFVNPIIETPLGKDRKPLLIRQPQLGQSVYTILDHFHFRNADQQTFTIESLSEHLLDHILTLHCASKS